MYRAQHQSLSSGRWQELTLVEQLANIGSEVNRTMSWKKNHYGNPQNAFYRALELIDLSINDPKNKERLSEICRTREALVDWYTGNNSYHTTDTQWEKYFYQFTYASRLNK